MRTSIRWMLGFLLLAAGGAGAAAARDDAGGARGGRAHAWDALKLSDEQKTQVHALWREQAPATRDARKELRQVRHDLRSEAFADTPDEAKIESLKQRLAELQSARLDARLGMERKMSALLTPEQRATLRSMPEPSHRGRGRHGHDATSGTDN